jgi:hypothetical protein
MNPFQSLRDYERFVYTLTPRFACIQYLTLVVAQRGRLYAELSGDVIFAHDYRLNVYERLSWDSAAVSIDGYSYELWRGSEKIYWYDSQPHPGDPTLASTDPHHKHLPPDIKHHRVPAPDLSFNAPNLEFLIREVESMLP